MISRRDALKWSFAGLTAAGVLANTTGGTTNARQSLQSDWPTYRGNPMGTGFMPGPGPGLDRPIAVKWKFELEKYGHCSPVVDNNVVYVAGGGEMLHAVDTTTGQELWRRNSTGLVWSIAVANNIVYMSDDQTSAINAQTNEVLWTFEHGGYSAITVVDDVVYFDGSDRNVYALDATTGSVLWHSPVTGWVDSSERYPVTVTESTVLVGRRDFLYAFDRESGAERWSFSDNEYGMGCAAVVDGIAYVGGDRSILYALDLENGDPIWQFKSGYYIQTAPAVANGIVYINSSNLQALDALTGQPIAEFSNEDGAGSESAPIVVDGLIYSAGTSFHCVDALSGEELWSSFPDYLGVETPAIVDGTIFIAADDYEGDTGYLYALGNVDAFMATTVTDTVIRGAPSHAGAERGSVSAGTSIDFMGETVEQNGEAWVDIIIDGVPGWIPLDVVDASTLEMEYVYIPDASTIEGTPIASFTDSEAAAKAYDDTNIGTALPGSMHMPGSFSEAGDSIMSFTNVAEALGGGPEAESVLTEHGWQAAMARTFKSDDAAATGNSEIVVSVNAFQHTESARTMIPIYESTLQGYGWEPEPMDQMGDGSVALRWTNFDTGEQAVTVYLVSNQLVYRVFAIGPGGVDSMPNTLHVVNQILDMAS